MLELFVPAPTSTVLRVDVKVGCRKIGHIIVTGSINLSDVEPTCHV